MAGRRQYDCRRDFRAHAVSARAPNKFEAGTGNIADAVGLGAAIDYVERIGLERIAHYEHDLLAYATHGLQRVPGLRLIGTAQHKASVLSFVLPGYRTEEIGAALNREGIAVRSGHHCAQPILAVLVWKPPCARRWRFITPARKWTRWWRWSTAWRTAAAELHPSLGVCV